MTEPTISPEQARQEIDAIRADKSHAFHRGDEAATAHVLNLYQALNARDAAPAANTSAPAQPTAADLDRQLHALRTMPAHQIRDPEKHGEQILALTERRLALEPKDGEDGPRVEVSEEIVAPILPPIDPKSGYGWDQEKVAELHAVAAREGVGASVIGEDMTLAAQLLGEPHTEAQAVRILRAEWGRAFDDQIHYASVAGDLLPTATQNSLTESRVRFHPRFIRRMSERGQQLLDPTNDRGLERALRPHREGA